MYSRVKTIWVMSSELSQTELEPLHNGEVLLLSREELRNLHPVDALGQIGVIVGILVGLALPGLPLPRF